MHCNLLFTFVFSIEPGYVNIADDYYVVSNSTNCQLSAALLMNLILKRTKPVTTKLAVTGFVVLSVKFNNIFCHYAKCAFNEDNVCGVKLFFEPTALN